MVRPFTPAAFAAAAVLAAASIHAATETWYDPALGSLPESQGWLYFTLPSITATFADATAGLDTMASTTIRGGWTRSGSSPFSRTDGVKLQFDLKLLAETHASTNRAGFSVIFLAHDKQGIELGFWPDRIWAQSGAEAGLPLFRHSEEALFDTTKSSATYGLELRADHYQLFANNQPILSGPIRDYTSFVGTFNPYVNSDYVFVGDDTTSASASIRLGAVTLTRGLPPSPPSLAVQRSGDQLEIQWPAEAPEIARVLESAPNPAGPWSPDSSPRVFRTGPGLGIQTVAIVPSAGAAFYRLR